MGYFQDVPSREIEGPTPEITAALVAPAIDRLRMTLMNAVLARGFPPSATQVGLDPSTGMMLAYLRNSWPNREVLRSSVSAVFTYQPEKPVGSLLDALVALGLLEEPGPARLRLSPTGRRVVTDLHLAADAVASDLWSGAEPHVAGAAPLVTICLSASRGDLGSAFELMAPRDFPAEISSSGILAEQLTGLRFHRFDAHIAAWRGAGYTIEDLEGLDDTARQELESETNRRAAAPYEALTPEQRAQLVAHLKALPYA